MLLEKLFDLLFGAYKWASPFAWVQPWEGGVLITSFLRWQRVTPIGPGLHVKMPFLQVCEVLDVAMTTHNLPPQSLTTLDGRSIAVGGVVKFSIKDVLPLFTSVVSRDDVLRDVSMGAIHRAVSVRPWASIIQDVAVIEKEIRQHIADDVNRLGFKIERFTFTDLAIVRAIRLMQELPQK
jgi:regulator of protease activity HflC (stomatin/prohibitin superfamily)